MSCRLLPPTIALAEDTAAEIRQQPRETWLDLLEITRRELVTKAIKDGLEPEIAAELTCAILDHVRQRLGVRLADDDLTIQTLN